jgi:hypothetical protein
MSSARPAAAEDVQTRLSPACCALNRSATSCFHICYKWLGTSVGVHLHARRTTVGLRGVIDGEFLPCDAMQARALRRNTNGQQASHHFLLLIGMVYVI